MEETKFNPTRRDFLGRGVQVIGAAAVIPVAFQSILRGQSAPTLGPSRRLVLVHLAGGNDGLNTVIPFRNDDYYAARPTIAIPRRSTLHLNDELGFHPAATGLKDLFDRGQLAVHFGVGYSDMSRSHAQACENWRTALASQRNPSLEVLHTTLAGFDTHENQLARHHAALSRLSDFLAGMHDSLDRTTILIWSEFGRRVSENGTSGTNHGKAGVLFLAGAGTTPGLHGELPRLRREDLDGGDLAVTIDFRSASDLT